MTPAWHLLRRRPRRDIGNPPGPIARDTRLDVWRGLCLVDVVLVHLAYNQIGFPEPLDGLIKHYTRFAAGGFVFLAGLTVATVFAPRYERSAADRSAVRRRLWRRATFLVLVDLCASAAYCGLDALRRFPAQPGTSIGAMVREVLFLQRPGLTGGILTFYALLLLATPAIFALHRRAGGWGLAAASAALYGMALAAEPRLHWPPNNFPVAYWQPLFIAGFLWRPALRYLDRGRPRRRAACAAAAAGAFAIVGLAQYGPEFGVSGVARLLPIGFDKTPLQLGQLLWYLAIVQFLLAASLLPWRALVTGTSAAVWLGLLGRHSLLVYTAHVFTEALVMEYVWSVWPPVVVRLGLAAADLVALGWLCKVAEDGLLARRTDVAVSAARGFFEARRSAVLAVAGVAVLIAAVGLIPLLRAGGAPTLLRDQPVAVVIDEASSEPGIETPVVDDALFEPGADESPLLGDGDDGPADELPIHADVPLAQEA